MLLSIVTSCKSEVTPPDVDLIGPYLTFSSDESFSINVPGTFTGGANCKLEYSTDTIHWNERKNTEDTAIDAAQNTDGKYYLYFKGTGITSMGYNSFKHWVLSENNVRCTGNIETLLDYKTVGNGGHPPMKSYCFSYTFSNNKALISAPVLGATTLTEYCYMEIFCDCSNLKELPDNMLPADTLEKYCYTYMFSNCTSLITARELPASTLASGCYSYMFTSCTALTTAPELKAQRLEDTCYKQMFKNCNQLSSITCLATDLTALASTDAWVEGVKADGTFTKATSSDWPRDINGIPANWTVNNI